MRPFHSKLASVIGSAMLPMIGLMASGCSQGNTFAPPPPPEVTVSTPARRAVTNYLEYTGTTKAVETVDLRARVKGFLKERHFEEGNVVKKDQLLIVIDEEPFQVALNMARAKLDDADASVKKAEQSKAKEVAEAQLALDQASLVLARIEEGRSKSLLARNAGTREALDQSEATRRKGEAQVEADRALLEQATADYLTNILSAKANVEAARADVRNAEINLGYCRIMAPFEGRISRRQFDVGNLVGDGQATVLATILRDDPIYAYINVSETDLLRFRQMAREGRHKDFEKGDEIALDLGLANEKGFPHRGKLNYADPAVDPASGTVQARGIFANPGRTIVPGLFARVRVALEERSNALLVPERALSRDQRGPYVLAVVPKKKDGKDLVERRDLRLGTLFVAGSLPGLDAKAGDLRVVESGLGPDDLVIVDGIQKARPDAEVKWTRDDSTPSPTASPVAAIAPARKSP